MTDKPDYKAAVRDFELALSQVAEVRRRHRSGEGGQMTNLNNLKKLAEAAKTETGRQFSAHSAFQAAMSPDVCLELIAREGELEHQLRNILAVIFRDGGQRAETYPTLAEAVEAAHEEWAALLTRMEMMRVAIQNFIDKVDRGEAISRRSYAEFKAALADQPGEMSC